MPYQGGKIPGNGPNQFAQVGMGGSQGGGQFEQGEGQSGSLQNQQGGTTTTRSVPLDDQGAGSQGDFAQQEGAEQDGLQQEQRSREQRSPGASDEDDELGTGADSGQSGVGI